MNSGLLLLISTIIAAVIGGVTNYLAIRMLFRPRKPIYVGKYKLPFTPGIIPKRRDQIASSLGHVVSEYLVTSSGLAVMFEKPSFRRDLEKKLTDGLARLASTDITLREWLLKSLTEEQIAKLQDVLQQAGARAVQAGVKWAWDHEWADRKASSILTDIGEDRIQQWLDVIAQRILEEVKSELNSLRGERLLKQAAGRILEQSGGFLGTLAGMFMDPDKIVSRIRPALTDALDSPAAHDAIKRMLNNQVEGLKDLTFANIMEKLAGQASGDWLAEKLGSQLEGLSWTDRLLTMPVRQIVEPHLPKLQSIAAECVGLLLNVLGKYPDVLLKSMKLPELVSKEVERFPIEQIEEIVLHVSGKEFRAITWLGALLGGIIGLFQGMFYLFWL